MAEAFVGEVAIKGYRSRMENAIFWVCLCALYVRWTTECVYGHEEVARQMLLSRPSEFVSVSYAVHAKIVASG